MSDFNKTELLRRETLVAEIQTRTEELSRRAALNEDLLVRVATAINNRVFDVFLFLLKYEPATRKQFLAVFPETTLRRALYQLESCGVIIKRKVKIKENQGRIEKYFLQK